MSTQTSKSTSITMTITTLHFNVVTVSYESAIANGRRVNAPGSLTIR